MSRCKRNRILSIALMLMMCVTASLPLQAEVKVKASLDSAALLMGDVTKLNLEVEKPDNIRGYLPLFHNNPAPYVTLSGDSVELSGSITSDTVRLGSGRERITYHIPVQAFDSGYYKIPGIEYVVGADTSASNPVDLRVMPVKAAATDEISDYTDVEDTAPGSWLDKVPDWVLNYWWAILAGLIALIAAGYFIYRAIKARRNRPVVKPVLPPYDEAVQALGELQSKELWQHGENELYFVELTSILRRYLSRRFGVSAPEMTTSQFMEEASSNAKLTAYHTELRRLLDLADFIKFAKGQSLPGENDEAFAIVRKFVEDTRPTKEELEAEKRIASGNEVRPSADGQNRNHTKKQFGRKTAKGKKRRKEGER